MTSATVAASLGANAALVAAIDAERAADAAAVLETEHAKVRSFISFVCSIYISFVCSSILLFTLLQGGDVASRMRRASRCAVSSSDCATLEKSKQKNR